MNKPKQLSFAAMIACVSTVAMADMGRVSHSAELTTEKAPVQSANWEVHTIPATSMVRADSREDAYL